MHRQQLNGQRESCIIDDELILTKCKMKCQSLEIQKIELLKIRENFQKLNAKNDHISKSLLKLKTEYELHKGDLCKTLFNLKLANEKQEIVSRRKINECLEKRKKYKEHLKLSPLNLELEELIDVNKTLQEQWRRVTFLLDLTKNQYEEIMGFLLKTFKMKVCEFCDIALRAKAVSHSD